MKELEIIKNDYSPEAKSLAFDTYRKFLTSALKIFDNQQRSKHSHIIKNAISNQESKTFFLLKKIKQYSLEVSTDDKNFTVKDFIKNVEGALMAVMQLPHCYNLLLEIKKIKYKEWKEWNEEIIPYVGNFLKELKISNLSVLPGCFDYLDKIYKKDKLFQPNLFIKVVAITRLFYAYLIWNQLIKLREKIEKDSNDSTIWIDAYKIGSLQGNLSLIEFLSDSDLIDIHFKGKSGERSQKLWNEIKKQEEKTEGPLVKEIRSRAKDIWDIKKKTDLHDAVVKNIFNEMIETHPEIFDKQGLLQLVSHTIRPMAKERGLLRGVPRPDFPGTVVKVDVRKRHIVVKNNVQKKTFFVSKAGGRGIQLADLKGMNVSVTYRIERGEMVARAISVTGAVGLPQKKVKKKPVKGPKK